MNRRKTYRMAAVVAGMGLLLGMTACGARGDAENAESLESVAAESMTAEEPAESAIESRENDPKETIDNTQTVEGSRSQPMEVTDGQQITLNPDWEYADHSKINSGAAVLYRAPEESGRKGIVIGVNAGHGTAGGSKVKTLCHPDGSAKTTGGSTAAGATEAAAVSGGMTFQERDAGEYGHAADGTDLAGQAVGLRL